MIITKTNSSLSWNAEKDGCIRCSNILMGQLIIIQCEEWKHKRYKDTDSNALSLWKKDYTQFRIVLVWWIHSHTSQALRQNALHYKNEISSNTLFYKRVGQMLTWAGWQNLFSYTEIHLQFNFFSQHFPNQCFLIRFQEKNHVSVLPKPLTRNCSIISVRSKQIKF